MPASSRPSLPRLLILLLAVLALAVALAACQPGAGQTPGGGPASPDAQHLLVMPDDGVDAALALIDGAKSTIRFKIYLLTYRPIRQALVRAAQRGVDVRVLIDQHPVGGDASNAASYQVLKDGGVHVKWAPGEFKNTHEKSLVVDDRRALIATFNFTHSSFTRNREYGLLSAQPDLVAGVAAIFDADWKGENVSLSPDSPLVLSPENSRPRIMALITGARRSLWLEEATLLDRDITKALAAAAKRGVEVRFLAPLRNENDRAAENLALLTAAGAQVARLDSPYIHAKAILVDDQRAFVGSENLTFTSFELNRELGVITTDPGVLTRLRKTMARDWEKAARSSAAATPTGVISWQEAEAYVGQVVTVQGRIVHVYDSGKVTFLNFDEDYHNTLTLVIFPRIYRQFPAPPATYFDGRQVQASGRIKMYEGKPEITIDDASQISLLGK